MRTQKDRRRRRRELTQPTDECKLMISREILKIKTTIAAHGKLLLTHSDRRILGRLTSQCCS